MGPIIVPILYESLRPSEHRCVEDITDAMIYLSPMDDRTRVSASSFNGSNSTPVTSGVMDLVRRGGGGGGRADLGGKLIRHCVQFHIKRAMANSMSFTDARGSCYWVLDQNAEDDITNKISTKDQEVEINQSTGSMPAKNSGQPT